MTRIIDITVPISPDLIVWPGDPGVEIQRDRSIAEGSSCNVSRYSFGSHTGTHVDPPLHFIDGAASIDELPLDALIGPAYVAHFPGKNSISADDLEMANIPQIERLILKTDNSHFWPPKPGDTFREDFAHLSPDGAKWVVDHRIKLIGIDYLSIQQFKIGISETHLILLSDSVVILEGVDLTHVEPGKYQLICLPLKVLGGDGSPARAVLIK